MTEQKVFEVRDYANECKPFKFKLPGNKTIYTLPSFSLLNAEKAKQLRDSVEQEDIILVIETMTDDEKIRSALKQMPLLALKELANAWKEAAGVSEGE